MALVFPALPGLSWSVTKTPTFQTRIQRAVSGRELRALDYPYPLWQFTLVFAFLRDEPTAGLDELRSLLGFYLTCQGAYGTFLFQDPNDYQVTGQYLGTGDSSSAVFPLQRTMGTSLPGGGFVEPIVAPNLVTAVYFDGITQNSAIYGIDPDTGLLTFATPPSTGLIVSADFSYWFRCRFVDDSYDFENFMYRLWQLKKLTFISVRT
jgi:uncharacterized protein (TIGR02217 family)